MPQKRVPGLRRLPNVGGLAAAVMSGASPSLIVKTSKSLPHVFSIHGESIRSLSEFNSVGCESGLLYIDNEVLSTLLMSWPKNLN